MTKEKAIEIVDNLKKTLDKIKGSDGIHSDNPMFKRPRAKRSDLIRKALIKKYKLNNG